MEETGFWRSRSMGLQFKGGINKTCGREVFMHLYWRVQQDLNDLGEVINFSDPRLVRSHLGWVCRNIDSLFMAMELDLSELIWPSMN